jgi:NADH-quinone oxidoreductase subunit F
MEKPLTALIQPDGQPLDVAGYERAGGYQALRKALTMAPEAIIAEVKRSRLRGRGGGGFSTGRKWEAVPQGADAPRQRYLVVNADEMEPGSFKDRLLLEQTPHQMIESVIIGAFAIQAEIVYIFVRAEYVLAIDRLNRAVAEAEARGYVGANVLGSGFAVSVHVHASGGRYICGESSAMCNVPHIIERGADWFLGLSRCDDGGSKLYGFSGRVKRPGLWELPLGTPLNEILEEHAGGMLDGYECRAVLPGGASTAFVMSDSFDIAMDFTSVQKVGSSLGTGNIMALDQRRCPIGLLRNLEHFFAQESCGWCTPCRDGLPWVERILAAIEAGEGEPEDLETLARHVTFLGPDFTFCDLAPGAMAPLGSGLKHFRAEFEQHISEKRCPWHDTAESWA